MIWKSGKNPEILWLQYGNFPDDAPLITFIRSLVIRKFEIIIHNLSAHMNIDQNIPCYANFSLESGEGDSLLAVDGMGFITSDQNGNPMFTSGNSDYPQDLSPFRSVILAIDDAFSFWVNNHQFTIPIDNENKRRLLELYITE